MDTEAIRQGIGSRKDSPGPGNNGITGKKAQLVHRCEMREHDLYYKLVEG